MYTRDMEKIQWNVRDAHNGSLIGIVYSATERGAKIMARKTVYQYDGTHCYVTPANSVTTFSVEEI